MSKEPTYSGNEEQTKELSYYDRVIIAVSEVSKENWRIIYKFIKAILVEDNIVSKTDSFLSLKKNAIGISLKRHLPSTDKTPDAYSLYGETNFDIDALSKDTCFSIIYVKSDDKEDFAELTSFALLQHEFGGAISLGIDIRSLSEQERPESYYFKCSDFFFFHDDIKPKLGKKSLYFIVKNNDNCDEETGEIKIGVRTKSFAGKGEEGKSKYQPYSSRRFLPLIHITGGNYMSLFSEKGDGDSKESFFVKDGIKKIQKEFEGIKDKKAKQELKKSYGNLFGQWLETAFFYTYDKDELKDINNEIEGIRNTIQVYKDSIQELVQNIIVHGQKNGLLYCVFDKKANVSESVGRLIPGFDNYDEDDRFMRVGVFDFGDQGIVDTFMRHELNDDDNIVKEKVNVKLTDFFDINSIVTTGLATTRLDMRYIAHLGIKTFVKTIVDHKGYFSVESCEHTQNEKLKRFLYTKVGADNASFSEEVLTNFVSGTHYEIILPVKESKVPESNSVHVQTTSISNKFSGLLKEPYPLPVARIIREDVEKIGLCEDKQVQKAIIECICSEILEKCGISKEDEKGRGIALDLCDCFVSPSSIFKIVAYLQLHLKNPLQKIVFVNVTSEFTKEFCSLIDKYLVRRSNDEIPVWNRDCAIIILCGDLNARIVWGKKKEELHYINQEYKRLYYNHFPDASKDNYPFEIGNGNIEENYKTDAEKFVLPYDVLIKTNAQGVNETDTSPFERFLGQLLRRKIISRSPGLSVNHENTYIGRKIIVKNYYEADSLFQNSFFVERFAYLIARNIIKEFSVEDDKYREKTIVLIGYKYYSEFLLKTIKSQMGSDYSILLCIYNEGKDNEKKDFSDTNNPFNFDINGDGEEVKKQIIANPNNYLFATIVPIGATLSTNDKVISFFKQWFEKNKNVTTSIEGRQFFYNHCVIVVRDKVGEKATILEQEQKWAETDPAKNFIVTCYRNAKKVHYTIQIDDGEQNDGEQNDGEQNDGEQSNGNWKKRLNDTISFPKDWEDEKYVNPTENSSINSQNLMDYPKVDPNNGDEVDNLEHIFLLKDYILKGHIQKASCHHKLYIDTESFVRKELNNKRNNIVDWLESKKEIIKIEKDKLNVLVTPNVESESDFVRAVNEYVFGGSAFVIYLDVKNWRNNIVNKLSFLRSIPDVRYHYVDQAFLTGDTYQKTKSYLFSIIDVEKHANVDVEKHTDAERRNVGFCSAFTIVNRMPYAKNKEIKKELKKNLFAFVNIYYPMGKEGEQECELCRLEKYYEDLSKKTVLQSCAVVIRKNKDKVKLVEWEDVEKRKDEEGQRRVFLRLVLTHWLYYRISKVSINEIDFVTKKENVKKELDYTYSSLCDELDVIDDSLLNQKIGQYFPAGKDSELHSKNKELEFFSKNKNKELTLDKKISFLKVISSPPLSQHIAIREYAHEKLLSELNKTINKKDKYVVDDLKLVKSILKSLSFLKSNALVRKDVLVGVWRVLESVIIGMDKKNKRKTIQDFSKDVQFFVKHAIVEDEAKATFLGELLRRGEEITDFKKIQISKTRLMFAKPKNTNSNELFKAFSKCKCDILRLEYSRFLVWLFYDNTTIIRNTLTNFSWELKKDDSLNEKFYSCEGYEKERKLKSIAGFKKDIDEIKRLFDAKVKEEYYYSSFMPYLENGDGIDYVEKLIFVTYAKLKLEDLINNKHKTSIESDTRDLMEIFAAIMGADAAFWTMKKEDNNDNKSSKDKEAEKSFRVYPISLYEKDCESGWAFDKFNMESSYTYQLYTQKEDYPFIPNYYVKQIYDEKKEMEIHSLGVYAISGNFEEKEINIENNLEEKEANEEKETNLENNTMVSCITFLYKDSNPTVNNATEFRIKFQESGRLLLLLKKDLSKYVVDYLLHEKVFELWVEQQQTKEFFKERYKKNTHNLFEKLAIVSDTFFDNSKIDKYHVNLYAILADLYVGKIHNSLLVNEKQVYKRSQYDYNDTDLNQFITCAKSYLHDNKIALDGEDGTKKFVVGDFHGKSFYYNKDIHFLLFQFVNNIIQNTKAGRGSDVIVSIYTEKDYLVIKNTHSTITKNRVEELNSKLKSEFHNEELTNSISLYCINHYFKQIIGKELDIDIEENCTFVVKIPIVVNN